MCGRYFLTETLKNIYSKYKIKAELKENEALFDKAYNISPGFYVPVVTQINKSEMPDKESDNLKNLYNGDQSKISENSSENFQNVINIMQWGLIPNWAKDPVSFKKLINTRAETINEKPSFKYSFTHRRCLIPATGFYEWKKTENKKIPYLIELKSKNLFSFAGIYDIWKDSEQVEHRTFSIITCPANDLIKPIHERMPIIFKENQENLWLDQNTPEDLLLSLLEAYPENELNLYTISDMINNPENQGVNLQKPIKLLPPSL